MTKIGNGSNIHFVTSNKPSFCWSQDYSNTNILVYIKLIRLNLFVVGEIVSK